MICSGIAVNFAIFIENRSHDIKPVHKRRSGAKGLYLAGAVAGATDVDAIALSMANRATTTPESIKISAYTLVIAVISNTLVEAGMAAFMAHRRCGVPSYWSR